MTRMRGLLLVWIVLCLGGGAPFAAHSQSPSHSGPSFACKAGQGVVEATVCGSPTLSASDQLMARLYALDQISAFGKGPSNILVGQREAVKAMQSCAKPPAKTSVADCVASSYDQRNAELAIAAAGSSPDLALTVLRKLDPPFAPIVEAIGLWASEPRDADWSAPSRKTKRARISALLAPAMTSLQTDKSNTFARDILSDSTGDNVAVNRIDDVFKSETHFADFVSVLGGVLPDSGTEAGRAIPCAAIVRHPKLLSATGSVYGSTLDNTVLNADCPETLPATPAMMNLDAKLKKGWPACDGTIRFAAYRTYELSLNAARLGIAEHDPKATLPGRDRVAAADVAAARAELTDYYVRYLGKAPVQAGSLASDAIKAVMNNAQQCD